MPEIEKDEVTRIAEMAQLSLTEPELELMTRELGAIVAYVKQLQEVDVSGVEPTEYIGLDRMPMRADEPQASLTNEAALHSSASTQDGHFAVPTFVDEG